MTIINNFSGKYKFLSNFWPCEIRWEDLTFFHVEGAYQASKSLDSAIRLKISKIESPGQAKRYGSTIQLRPTFAHLKFDVMLQLVKRKFCIPELSDKLLATGDAKLVESNNWHDTYYGICQGHCKYGPHEPEGHNALGKILMEVRKSLPSASGQGELF
jgi:ribA/ribD-fused uncharacterized protein